MTFSDPHASRAVLIGVHAYDRMPDLPAVARNLADLRAALTDPETWGLPDAHCRVIDQPRSTESILAAVAQAGREATDTLVVYYAGHGLTDPYSDQLHLMLTGSNPEFSGTALAFDYLRGELRDPRVRAPRRVLILDCCYSGRALTGAMGAGDAPRAAQAVTEGTHVLTSSDATKVSWSPPGEPHTAFTGEILRVLTEGIPDGPGLLSTEVIYRHVHTQLAAKRRPLPQQANRNAGGDIVIARNRAVPGAPLAPPPPPPPLPWRRILLAFAVVVAVLATVAIVWRPWESARVADTALPGGVRDCRAAGSVPDGADTAFSCRDSGGRPADVAIYPDRAALETAYGRVLDGSGVVRSTGDCAANEGAEHRYPLTGAAVGRVLCAGTSVTWTDDRVLALARVDAPAAEPRQLRDSWLGEVAAPPPFPTGAETTLVELSLASECGRAPVGELDDFSGAVAAVTCAGTGGAGAQSVTYVQFDSTARLQQTMSEHLPADRDPATVDCDEGTAPKFTDGGLYNLRGVNLGVLLCYPATDGSLVIEWSVEALLVAGRAVGSEAVSLADWWRNERGPATGTVVEAVNRRDAFPTAAETALLDRIPAPTRRNCMRPSGEYRTDHVGSYRVTAGVVCGPSPGPPIIFYYQFEDAAELTENFNPGAGPDGDCTASPTAVTGEGTYSRGGATGRLRCENREGGNLARIWTDERRLVYVLAFQGKDARAMSDWWEHDAGPL